jgi:hypothetical protein
MTSLRKTIPGFLLAGIVWMPGGWPAFAAEVAPPDVRELIDQNHQLLQQVQKQQQQIDELRERLDRMQNPALPAKSEPSVALPEPEQRSLSPFSSTQANHQIRLSGEVGLAYFSSGRLGAFPNSEFRVDDARLFVEAPVWKNVYFFTGMELATRETGDESFHLGELYADVEDVFRGAGGQTLSLRVGRFNIPFGEEYQERNVMDNPLISHSIADIWGIDSGVQVYGSLGPIQYNLGVQDGGLAIFRDRTNDKAVVARLSFSPFKPLHLSASAYRTGKLSSAKDDSDVSAIWIGGELLGSIGSPVTTRNFQATLYELDAAWRWKQGHVKALAGTARFTDDNTAADDSRDLNFYSVEAMQQLTGKIYGAARYGSMRASGSGYPIVGLGDYGRYFYASPPTRDLHRLSLAVGYRFDEPLLLKFEYSWEDGRLVNGVSRDQENLFATELGLKF